MDLRKAERTVISLRVAIGRGVLMALAVAAGEAVKGSRVAQSFFLVA